MPLLPVALAAALALAAPRGAAPRAPGARPPASSHTVVPAVAGEWEAVAFDAHPLPAAEEVPAQKGWHHYVRLDQSTVTLRPDGHFVASFRYYHQHLADGARVGRLPLMSDTYRGRWLLQGSRITLVPDPTTQARGHRRPDPIVGTVQGDRMQVAYTVVQGTGRRTLRVALRKGMGW